VLAGLFLVSGLAMLSLPGLSTFVSEFLVLVGTFTRYRAAAVAATAGIILAAIYILWLYQRTMTGPVRPGVEKFPDLRARELLAVGPLIGLLIFFGFFPQPLLNIINPAVSHTLVQVHATDPVPPHPAPAVLSRHAASPPGHSGLPPVAALPGRSSGLPAAPVTISHRQKGTTP
jgi:NADH-quinone oxidoreductase subunit M